MLFHGYIVHCLKLWAQCKPMVSNIQEDPSKVAHNNSKRNKLYQIAIENMTEWK